MLGMVKPDWWIMGVVKPVDGCWAGVGRAVGRVSVNGFTWYDCKNSRVNGKLSLIFPVSLVKLYRTL